MGGSDTHLLLYWPNVGASHGCEKQAASDTGQVSLKSLIFGPSFVWKWIKGFQLQGALPLDPTRGSTSRPPLQARSPCSPWSTPLWQVLDPALEECASWWNTFLKMIKHVITLNKLNCTCCFKCLVTLLTQSSLLSQDVSPGALLRGGLNLAQAVAAHFTTFISKLSPVQESHCKLKIMFSRVTCTWPLL